MTTAKENCAKVTTVIDVEKLSEAELRELVPDLLSQLKTLTDRVEELNRTVFGRSSEKSRYAVGLLPTLPFAEFKDLADKLKTAEAEAGTVEVPAHTRKKTSRRKDFPDHLPRRTTTFTLSAEQRACPDCGDPRKEIGEETASELERIEFTYVHNMVRKKFACRQCEGQVVIADGGQRVLPKSILGPGFLAQIIFDRFGNHMPYARLEKKYRAEGLSLARSVMCSSVLRCAELLKPVFDAHQQDVLESLETSVLQSDDTTILQRNGKNPGQRKIFLWAWRDQKAGVFYTASDHRNREGPRDIIGDRRGRLQCDGHDCYSGLDGERIHRNGCWSHVRRYFDKARRAGDENSQKMMGWIRQLFAIEREAKDAEVQGREMTDSELVALRQEKSKPIITAVKTWLDSALLHPPSLPDGILMKGVRYALNQWPTLVRFLDDGRVREISNNGCERALRAPVIGRKNWSFFGSEEGTKAGLIMMSLVQSCREHKINPLLYLRDVLHLISTTPQSRVGELTPRGWKATGNEGERQQCAKAAIAEAIQSLSF